MPGSLSHYAEELALNMLFRNIGESPIKVYLGLATQPINDSDLLSNIIEEIDKNYSRQEIVFDYPKIVSDINTIKNEKDINFPPWSENATALITHCFITDIQIGKIGNILAWFELEIPKQPAKDESISVPAGNLIFSLD